MDLSILIVNWNTCGFLARCLASIAASRISPDCQVPGGDSVSRAELSPLNTEVIVVDNASKDDSTAMVRRCFPWVRLIENTTNAGFAAANNQAIGAASGRHLLLLNSDTEVHAGALGSMVTFLGDHSRAGACGARLLNGDGSLQHACHPMLTPEREAWRLAFGERVKQRATYPMASWPAEHPQRVEAIKGACLMVRRAALEEVGLLDEGYFMYTEEVDLCHRLGLAGWELWYVPQAVVTHFGGASSSQVADDMYVQLYRSKILFYRKFGGDARARRAKAWFGLAYGVRWAAAAGLGAFRPAWRARAALYGRLLAELPRM